MNKFDKQHITNLNAYSAQIDKMYREAISQAAKMSIDLHGFNRDKPFSFTDYPIANKKAVKLVEWLSNGVLGTIEKGARNEWVLSNKKNDATVKKLLKGLEDIPSQYLDPNNDALEAFLKRKTAGLGLSDRVWQYTEKFKQEIELGLDLGIRSGRSADEISRDIRAFLNHPAELYRRVKTEMVDKNGNPIWHLSKAARDYHPGQGVYRSSYKNAKRLAATETNMAYREADNERWQKLDFVIGQHVIRSKRHDSDGIVDICDELSGIDENDKRGRFPKDFKFTGWHPQCRCFVVPIMSDIEEMVKIKEAYLKGEKYEPKNEQIKEMPDSFVKWVDKNAEKIKAADKRGSLPYFIRDNRGYFGLGADRGSRLQSINANATTTENRQFNGRPKTEDRRKEIQDRWNERKAILAEIDKYDKKRWSCNYVSPLYSGYVMTELTRIASSLTSKNEQIKFEKEMRMNRIIANNGHKVKYLSDLNRGANATYDIMMDEMKADLKCVEGGASNIVKYVKKALTKQGGKAVVIEIPNGEPQFYSALKEAKRKTEGRIFFYIKGENVLKEIK